jgi:hypothetical protein
MSTLAVPRVRLLWRIRMAGGSDYLDKARLLKIEILKSALS